jgi:hypothetical protein
MSRHDAQVSEYIAGFASPQKEIGDALRNLILRAFPDMREAYKWKYAAYYDGKKRICLFGGFKGHVGLELFYGSHLDDPKAVLEGEGKHTRHIKYRSVDEIDAEYLTGLIRQSIEFARAGKFR